MIHDEIVSGVYATLNTLDIPVFKHESAGSGERIVIQLKDNQKDIFQRGMLWILIYVPKLDDLLPDHKRCNVIKELVSEALEENIVISKGDLFAVEEFGVTGPLSDPDAPQESLYLLTYRVKAIE